MHGSSLRPEEWATVTCPTLVAYGAKTVDGLKHASRALADVLPNATLLELPAQKTTTSRRRRSCRCWPTFAAGSARVAI